MGVTRIAGTQADCILAKRLLRSLWAQISQRLGDPRGGSRRHVAPLDGASPRYFRSAFSQESRRYCSFRLIKLLGKYFFRKSLPGERALCSKTRIKKRAVYNSRSDPRMTTTPKYAKLT